MKPTLNPLLRFVRSLPLLPNTFTNVPLFAGIVVFTHSLVMPASVQAATTGFNQTAAGPWDYNDSANWAAVTINGLWDTSLTLAAAQTVTFGTDTTLSGALTFNYAGNQGLTLKSAAAGTINLTLGGNLSVNTSGGTSANVTIGNATNHLAVNLGGVTRTIGVSPGRTLTLVDAVSNGGIIKTGAGTLVLSGTEIYAGGVTLNAGKLTLGSTTALGSAASTLTINGGTLDSATSNLVLANNNAQSWNGDFVFAGTQNLNLGTGAVTLNATRQVTVSANTLTVGGVISGSSLGLTKAGTGTLALTGANDYTGTTTISAGTLQIGAGGTLGSLNAGSSLVLNGGTLAFNRTDTLTQGTDFANAISGAGNVTQAGSGTTILLGTNTQVGLATISAGKLQLGNGGTAGSLSASGTLVDNGTLVFNRSDDIVQGTAFSAYPISGTGGLTKLGTGKLTLNSLNTFSGNTVITDGKIALGHAQALQNSAYDTTGSTGAIGLDLNGCTTPTLGGLAGTIDLGTAVTGYSGSVTALTLNPQSGKSVSYSGIIGEATTGMTLTKTGAGTQTLTGVNAFTGALTVNNGTLIADTTTNPTILQTVGLAFAGSGTFQLKGVGSSARSQSFSGLTLTTGAATIDANRSGTADTTISLGGITRSAGATVDFKASGGTLGTNALVTTTRANDTATNILGAWATVAGGGDWAIANGSGAAAAYTGYNTLSATTLSSSGTTNYRVASNPTTPTGNITMAAEGTIDINTLRISDSAARTVDVRNGTTQGILRVGAVGGILTSGGTHVIGVTGAGNMGTLTAGGAADTAGELIINNATGLTVNSVIADNGAGAVSLTKSGTGTLTLSAANSYSAGTTLNAGGLTLSNKDAIGNGTFTINGGTLTLGTLTLPNNMIVLNGNCTVTSGLAYGNTGSGQLRINKSGYTISGNGNNDTGAGFTIGNTITDANGNNTLNAFDIIWNVISTTAELTLSGNITLRGDQTLTANVPGGDGFAITGNILEGTTAGYGLTITGTMGQPTGSVGGGGRGNYIMLAGTNTYTGNTTITPGAVVSLGNKGGSSTGSLNPTGSVINNGVFAFNRSNNIAQNTDFGTISGSGSVIQSGAGVTTLGDSNTYAGTTIVAGGTLSFGTIANAGSTSSIGKYPVAGAGGISLVGGTLQYTGGSGASTNRGFTVNGNSTVDVKPTATALTMGDTTLGAFTLNVTSSAASSAGSSLTVGAMTLAGNATVSPSTAALTAASVNGEAYTLAKTGAGALAVNGATTLSSLKIADGAAGGTMTIGSAGSVTIGNNPADILIVGDNGGVGTLDASLSTGVTATVGNVYIGVTANTTANANGTLKLGNSNTLTAYSRLAIGSGLDSSGTTGGNIGRLEMAGGTTAIHTPLVTVGYGINNGTTSGTGYLTLSGGTLTLDGPSSTRTELRIGVGTGRTDGYGSTATGTMDLTGGKATLVLNSLKVGTKVSGGGASTGTLTLGTGAEANHLDISGTGSVVRIGSADYTSGAPSIAGPGTGTVTLANLDGTSSIVSTDNGTAILVASTTGAGASSTGTLNITSGTLTITTSATAIGKGGGTGNLVLGGASTNVTLKPGAASTTWITGFTGGTSSAAIDAGGVTFDTAGYDLTIPQGFADVTGHAGKLTKDGEGILTLSGLNTYSGDTTVSNGSLVLADDAGLTFVVADAGNNKLTGTGAATLAGDFTINTSAVTAESGTWVLIENLANKTFATSFTVAGTEWSEASNIWTKVDGANTWRFNEANGTLTLNIAPGGFASWASGFSSPALSNTAPDADPDGDGLANALEYVFGTDPRYSNPGGPQADASGTDFVLTFSRNDASETPDVMVVVEVSNDLADWTTHPSYTVGADTASSTEGVTVSENGEAADTITVTVPKNGNVKLFGRVRAIVSP